ncbi:fatty acid desaturase [Cupriavidus basilensis]|uniref:Fatty acid desaturase n=1 Tax=Cupriavidus basilensis TaxID=68895 RepID=A0ABT6AS37_9BURK|nr:fatty acid desaturase [Cupriavidus basilensis]MDF3835198.1 fatty acid desaturase [Cupriavidus basilensis]
MNAYTRSWVRGLSAIAVTVGIWLAVFTAALYLQSYWLKAPLGVALGFATGMLFVVGHDAAHGSLLPGVIANRICARIALLPALHPLCTWETGHNRLHHGWTGLIGKDAGYPPFSPEQYSALSPARRFEQRVYRSLPGFGLYYLVDVWWRCQILARPEGFREFSRQQGVFDYLLVVTFICAQVWMTVAFSSAGTAAANLLVVVIIPFIVWNYVMAFVTLQHHTHPSVRWARTREEWDFFHGQVEGTVHVQPPRWLDVLFGNIFQHTAHHVDKGIPLYHLVVAQTALESRYRASITYERMSLSHFRRILGMCQLYDFGTHRWLQFRDCPLPLSAMPSKASKEGGSLP